MFLVKNGFLHLFCYSSLEMVIKSSTNDELSCKFLHWRGYCFKTLTSCLGGMVQRANGTEIKIWKRGQKEWQQDSRKSSGIQESVAKTYGFRRWYCFMSCKLSIPGKFQGKNIRSLQPLHSRKCHRSKSCDCLMELEERFKFLIIKEENLDVKLW